MLLWGTRGDSRAWGRLQGGRGAQDGAALGGNLEHRAQHQELRGRTTSGRSRAFRSFLQFNKHFMGRQALGSLHSFICPLASKKCLAHLLALSSCAPNPGPAPGPALCPVGAGSWPPRPPGFQPGVRRTGEEHIAVTVALAPCLPQGLLPTVAVSPSTAPGGQPLFQAPAMTGSWQNRLLPPL